MVDFNNLPPVNPHSTRNGGTPDVSNQKTNTAPMPSTPYGRPGGNADEIMIDLSNVDTSGGNQNRYVAPGRRLGYVSNMEYTTSKAGNPMIVWDIRMYQGEYDGIVKKVWTALTPEALWKVHEMCEAVGFPLDTKRFSYGALRDHALNTFVIATLVDDGEYNGSPRTKIQGCEPPTEVGVEAGTKIPAQGVPR